MKSAQSLTLSILLLAFTTNLPLIFSEAPEEIKDSKGVPISPSGKYYILQFNGGPTSGGGLFLASNGNSTCQVTVMQDYYEGDHGVAVKFSTAGRSSGAIFSGTQLDIACDHRPSCASSSKWVVVSDDFPGKWLGIGGAGDHPGKKVITGTFNIQKYNGGYKFVFCLSTSTCYDIATKDDGETGRRLYSFPTTFSRVPEQVLDSQSSSTSSAEKYYILPFYSGPTGGGVAAGKTGNSTCDATVLQTSDESNRGHAVKCSRGGRKGGIFTGTPLDIEFVDKPSCASSSKWVVVSDNFPEKWVGIGGARDYPGKKIRHGTFNIQKFDAGYKLVFCATTRTCYDIGRHDDENGRRLVLTNKPFEFASYYAPTRDYD
ncbi:unnamed protein product [Sphenostylis stenocarpa]|uniref:Uncharacterized protein n=1 Tax=Sphenostylis stenocarpa TaxID=92480 RepID=A0AA86SD76_9FABA|nr:unnamed protein product [Sphenostylis stenocarpa]